MGIHFLLQGIFPTQGSNPGLLHCRQILNHLSHQGGPFLNRCIYLYLTASGFSEKAMAPYSSTLALKIPWMEEPGRLQSIGWLRVRHDWATSLSLFTFMHWRRKWQPTPMFLPGESQGWGNLVGCRLWGCRVGHDWSDLAAAVSASGFYYITRDLLMRHTGSVVVAHLVQLLLIMWDLSSPTRDRTQVPCTARILN